ncbi:MAG: VCBS repeat-containing protein [Lysobacter sp.]|nr:VCBS repeat-containing protein [Lysobacter sp.]
MSPMTPLQLGSPVDAVAIGDVTGDGRNDIVVSTHQNDAGSGASTAGDFKVSVFVQQTDGSLAAPLQAGFPGFMMHLPSKGLALVDLNEDGLRDIVLAYGGGLYIYEGAATGQLSGRAVPGLSAELFTVSALDVNGDGHADIAAFDGFSVRMFLGDGQGTLTHSYTFSTSPVGLTNLNAHMAPGDLNGDGRTDLAFYDGHNQGVVFLQTVGGTFERWSYNFGPYPSAYFTALAVADFDADGDQDLMLAARQTQRNIPLARHQLYRQSGGQLLEPLRWGVYEVASGMIGADLDRDGRQDLVTVRCPSNVNAWIGYSRQLPEGGFDTEIQLPLPRMMDSISPRGLAAGDFTGDGCTDLAATSGTQLILYRAQCEPPMTTGGRLPPELLVAPGGASAGAVSLQAPAVGEGRASRARRTSNSRTESQQTQLR